jgi:hypothetical protein
MKIVGTFMASWAAAGGGVYAFVTQDRVIPAEQVQDYQVGSAALGFVAALLFTLALFSGKKA